MAAEKFECPKAIVAPIDIFAQTDSSVLYAGPANYGGREGEVTITLDFFPRPKTRFEFSPQSPYGLLDLHRDSPWDNTDLELLCPNSKTIEVTPLRVGTTISGTVSGESVPLSSSRMRLLVINGPRFHGDPIDFGDVSTAGRVRARVADCSITIDQIPSLKNKSKDKDNAAYRFTHLVELMPDQLGSDVTDILDTIFRSLSFMKGRWVGLVGPWCFDENDQLVDIAYRNTKVSHYGDSVSWFYEDIRDALSQLAPMIHATRSDEGRYQALLTAQHWSVESSLCAGGVEGSLILQQAALECLSWHELIEVQNRHSKSRFKDIPAADKIRELLTSWNIGIDIPSKFDAIANFAQEKKNSDPTYAADIPAAMVSIRNILVHAEPSRSLALFSRERSSEEIMDIWKLAQTVLQQAILASLGYQGKIVNRNTDATTVWDATGPVPWAIT
ncbi:hypothetical protein DTL42_02070 [Bremerella cremea]|uniref:YopA central domain-containing protein n=1 Tax=Bremerella cremea TaxID=1031537 RepID=A0A368KU68_9BACT|nr:hypothetical protein [Bremerella cremea]RCS53970.1 hypothetical protein DTL42_02070 [Bremerella cremea]